MSGIRGANTKPELLVRRGLHRRGLRFRLHRKKLAGRPDIVFSRYRTVVFVHGCFWHAHECRLFSWPKSNAEFWRKKILDNRKRDQRNVETLLQESWRVIVIWECALRGKDDAALYALFATVENDIRSANRVEVITHAG